jgi:hypothetical protein
VKFQILELDKSAKLHYFIHLIRTVFKTQVMGGDERRRKSRSRSKSPGRDRKRHRDDDKDRHRPDREKDHREKADKVTIS